MFQRVAGRLGGRIFQRGSSRSVARRLRSSGGKNGSRNFSSSSENGSRVTGFKLATIGGTVIGTATAFSLGYYLLKFDTEVFADAQDAKNDAAAAPVDDSGDKGKPRDTEEEEEEPPIDSDYLIIGGGPAAYGAIKEIFTNDPNAKILVVSEESLPPYQRTPLSKDCWWLSDSEKGEQMFYMNSENQLDSVIFAPKEAYPEGIELMLSQSVVRLNPVNKVVELSSGKKIQFKKCLIATGSSPVWPNDLDAPDDDPRVRTFRTADDFQALYRAAKDPAVQHITVIGGGFLGTELAGALSLRSAAGLKVSQIVPESGVISSVFPDYLSAYVTSKLKNKDGIDVRTATKAKSVTKATDGSNRLVVELDNGSKITTDFVVVAAGAKPNVGLAEDANFEIDRNNGGIVVNHEFQIRSDIYAAGDVASYWDYQLGIRRREAHNDHSLRSGALAGLNMTGRRKAYTYEPAYTGFFSDDAYLAVGVLDSKLETVGVWQKGTPSTENPDTTVDNKFQASNTFDKGAVYYLNDKRKVVGVLLWNMLDRAEEARHALFVLREFNDDMDKIKRQIYIGDVPPQAAADEAATAASGSHK